MLKLDRKRLVALVPLVCSYAAVAPRYSVEDLVDHSPVILRATIDHSWTAWDANHRYLWTHHALRVSGALQGSAGATTEIAEPGGTLDGVSQAMSGAVAYAPGEDLVLFLYRTPIGYWRTSGGPQGKFIVDRQGSVRAFSNGTTFVGDMQKSATAIASLHGLSYTDFEARLRRMIAARPAARTAPGGIR